MVYVSSLAAVVANSWMMKNVCPPVRPQAGELQVVSALAALSTTARVLDSISKHWEYFPDIPMANDMSLYAA